MEDEWDVDAMIEEQERLGVDEPSLASTPNRVANASGEVDDEEMWSMVREIEMG